MDFGGHVRRGGLLVVRLSMIEIWSTSRVAEGQGVASKLGLQLLGRIGCLCGCRTSTENIRRG